MLETLLAGLGIALAIEGFAYAIAPGGMKRFMRQLQDLPDDQLRQAGLVALFLGAAFVWAMVR